MGEVSVYEARNRLSELLKAASAGEEIVIAKRGTPVARLVGMQPTTGVGISAWLAANRVPRSARSAEVLDEVLAGEREAWD